MIAYKFSYILQNHNKRYITINAENVDDAWILAARVAADKKARSLSLHLPKIIKINSLGGKYENVTDDYIYNSKTCEIINLSTSRVVKLHPQYNNVYDYGDSYRVSLKNRNSNYSSFSVEKLLKVIG